MSTSVRPDPVADYLAAKQSVAPDPVSDYLTARLGHDPNQIHRDFQSGALQKRNARANANDQDELAAEPGYVDRFATNLLNTGQGIPGVEAIEAGAGSLGSKLTKSPQSYGQALATLRQNTNQLPALQKVGEKVAGSMALLPFLPASPIRAGAAVGAADAGLGADPDQSLLERGGKAALGGAVGGAAGKVAETAITGIGSMIGSSSASNLLAKQAARAKSAADMYGAALAEGQGKAATPAIQAFLAEPDIAETVRGLQTLRQYRDVAPESPEMLHAIYKDLSDQASGIKRGLASPTPARANTRQAAGVDVGMAKSDLLDALRAPGPSVQRVETAQSAAPSLRDAIDAFQQRSGEAARRVEGTLLQQNRSPFVGQRVELSPTQLATRNALERHGAENVVSPSLSGAPPTELGPSVMPSYANAVQDYANRSAEIDALRRGQDLAKGLTSKGLSSGKSLDRTTPEAFQQWAAGASQPEIEAASEGLLGGTKQAMGKAPLTKGRVLAGKAPSLLRDAGSRQQAMIDQLVRAGLVSTGAARSDAAP